MLVSPRSCILPIVATLLFLCQHGRAGQGGAAGASAEDGEGRANSSAPSGEAAPADADAQSFAAAIRAETIREIQNLGGEIEWDQSPAGRRAVKLTVVKRPVTDAHLALLQPLDELREVTVHGLEITDAGLAALASLARLERLRLNYTRVTDAGIARQGSFSQLRELDLTGCFRVTDAGLKHLKRLPKLRTLNLTFTRATDECIADLRTGSPDLEVHRWYGIGGGDASEAKDPARQSLASHLLRRLRSKSLRQRADSFSERHDWTGLAVNLDETLRAHPDEIWLWRMHAWNCAYNLAAEPNDPLDRYFWIAQGIRVLVCAAQRNPKRVEPVWDVGWFVAQRIGRSDDARLFRALFADDAELHQALIVGFSRDEVLGPAGKPDNWLVARRWSQKACDLLPQNPDAELSPIICLSQPPSCLIHYAEAMEQDGVFGERARRAWQQAAEQWRDFGDHPLPTTAGPTIRLNELPEYSETARRLGAKLDDLAPGLREEISEQRTKAIPPAMLRAWKKEATERNLSERELAARVETWLKITNVDIAEKVEPPHRAEARRLAKQADAAKRMADVIGRYRSIVNFDYWTLRCRIERLSTTLSARQRLYQASRELEQQPVTADHLAKAKSLFDDGFALWRQTFDAYPTLYEDPVLAEELLPAIESCRRAFLGHEPLPQNFPLKELVDRWADR